MKSNSTEYFLSNSNCTLALPIIALFLLTLTFLYTYDSISPLPENNLSSSPFLSPSATNNSTYTENSPRIDHTIRGNGSLISPTSTNHSASTTQALEIKTDNASSSLKLLERENCDISRGSWVRYPKGPYYTNWTQCVIDDRQNCMKFGRPDTEFLKWRWKPNECDLPLFDAVEFLGLVRGKTMAFVGDSVGRNQMQSLVCLLASVANPVDVSYTPDTRFRRWLYIDYNFTIIALWSPLLVKSQEANPQANLMNLYIDQADEAWASQIEPVDIVILSAGQWFFRPFVFYKKGKIVGCHICNKKNIKNLDIYYSYKMAFRAAFRALLRLKNFKGVTFLRTFSPAHFEHGGWADGGYCDRTRPFTKDEMKLNGYNLELYKTQVKELRVAERRGKKRGLSFRLLDTTEAMVLRPDGHPNYYGHRARENKTIADCVHWCMPGPVDTWNEFLLQMLKVESESLSSMSLCWPSVRLPI